VTHVYRKRGRQPQKYRVRWDCGSISQVLHEHVELVSVPEGSVDVGGGVDINEETEYDRFVTVDGAETDDAGELDKRIDAVMAQVKAGLAKQPASSARSTLKLPSKLT
jgi:hypothetical protein